MKIAVAGLFHLGSVTAGALAKAGNKVLAYDPDTKRIQDFLQHRTPIFEPGLDDLIKEGLQEGHLRFSNNAKDLSEADLTWICYDTPLDEEDHADVDYVTREILSIYPHLKSGSILMISSQLPAGSTQSIKALAENIAPDKKITFAYSPENLRLGNALNTFMQAERIVIGLDDLTYKPILDHLLRPFSKQRLWMSIVSAEMTKHAINAFLAISVSFANELAVLCEALGANARDVETALRSEQRIGPKAYLKPGDALAGGTLLRDIHYLKDMSHHYAKESTVINAVIASNAYHKQWSCRKLASLFPDLKNKRIAVLGLTYKPGTNTLRRSQALETCAWLHEQGSIIQAYDPILNQLPVEYAENIQLKLDFTEALTAADAVLISTAWPEFREIPIEAYLTHLHQKIILDPSGFLSHELSHHPELRYYSVGVPTCN